MFNTFFPIFCNAQFFVRGMFYHFEQARTLSSICILFSYLCMFLIYMHFLIYVHFSYAFLAFLIHMLSSMYISYYFKQNNRSFILIFIKCLCHFMHLNEHSFAFILICNYYTHRHSSSFSTNIFIGIRSHFQKNILIGISLNFQQIYS